MVITPENELERAMLQAATEASARPAFYRLLLDSELVVLGKRNGSLALDTVQGPDGEYHPVFSAETRIKALLDDPAVVQNFKIKGRRLFEITRGAQFVLNPGSSPNKVLTAGEIDWCLKTFQPQAELIVAQPKVYPTRLIKALCILFTSRQAIRAAHLVYVARDGIDTEAHPMIGLEAEGDVPRLAQEIFDAAEAVMPNALIEVVYLDTSAVMNPLQKHLLSVPPFYRRTLPPN